MHLKVWHIRQSWTEAIEHSKLMQDKMDQQHCISSPGMLSRQDIKTNKVKLENASGLSNHINEMQRSAC